LLDSIFVAQGGRFCNEIIWYYDYGIKGAKKVYAGVHDTILFCAKSEQYTFNPVYIPYKESSVKCFNKIDEEGKKYMVDKRSKTGKVYMGEGKRCPDVFEIPRVRANSREAENDILTKKPQKLLEQIIKASSNEGDVVMDCFCGCGTTIEAAHKLGRRWIGIDISYNSISTIMQRMDREFGEGFSKGIPLRGIPKDWEAAQALSLRADDPTRKEFEKWAILTYSNARAGIHERKGRDGGIDGIAYMSMSAAEVRKIILQVKSGRVSIKDLKELHSTIEANHAIAGILITLYPPTSDMEKFAHSQGIFKNPITGQNIERLKIVTIQQMMDGARMALPMIREVLK
jgi:site-specific DNA-methyltransferase (adenine-specific)